ncbi:uncharacterized protein BcabD6B2_39030 [Babesia caballi]|uniref:Uncharacterized protein n=1 Tax=Babesia caballi TaxID=5871 RepID=A0AAV4LWC2_BABCB|nr:hypothetical protein, conserved [Babesia caballi]
MCAGRALPQPTLMTSAERPRSPLSALTLTAVPVVPMHSVQRFARVRDCGFEPGSVRRYNVEYAPVYTNPASVVQDGSGNMLFVVARRHSVPNFQSYMPFDVFTHINEWADVKDIDSVAGEDIFDQGISSSEDEEDRMYIGEATPPLIASPDPVTAGARRASARFSPSSQYASPVVYDRRSAQRSVDRSVALPMTPPMASPTPRRSLRAQHVSPVREARELAEPPLDEGPAYADTGDYDPTANHMLTPDPVRSRSASRNVSFAKSLVATSPRPRGKRTLSERYDVTRLSPTGYSPFASFGAVYSGGLDSHAAKDVPSTTRAPIVTTRRLNSRKSKYKAPVEDTAPADKAKRKKSTSKQRVTKAVNGDVPKPVTDDSTMLNGLQMRIADASLLASSPVHGSFEMSSFANYSPSQFLGDTITHGPMVTSELADLSVVPREASQEPALGGNRIVSTAVVALPRPTEAEVPTGTEVRKKPSRRAKTAANHIESVHSEQGVQTVPVEPLRTSLGVGNDDFDMGEYGTLADRVDAGQLGITAGKKPAPPRNRNARNGVSSAMLLNSWYISYVDERKGRKKRYKHVEPYESHNRRYPTRTRLPPIQHWNSNMTSDGSSVLFLIGVTSDDRKLNVQAQHASGDVVLFSEDTSPQNASPVATRVPAADLPEASLVLTDSSGTMEMQVIEAAAELRPAIANKPHESGGSTTGALALLDDSRAVSNGISADAAQRAAKPLAIDRGPATTKRATSSKRANKSAGSKGKTTGNKKRSREMTVTEALEILQSDGVGSLGLDESPKGRRHSEFYQELVFNPAKRAHVDALPSDSVAMQNGRHISYRSFFRVDEVETQMYSGSLFQPMIMNSRCRTSNVIIPVGKHVSMGNVHGNFIVSLFSSAIISAAVRLSLQRGGRGHSRPRRVLAFEGEAHLLPPHVRGVGDSQRQRVGFLGASLTNLQEHGCEHCADLRHHLVALPLCVAQTLSPWALTVFHVPCSDSSSSHVPPTGE